MSQLVTRGSRIRRLLAKSTRNYRNRWSNPKPGAGRSLLLANKSKYRKWGLNPYQKPGKKN